MRLSENFSLNEFTASDTAVKQGIANTPIQSEIANLQALVNEVLQPLRNWCGKPVKVTSGYRCFELNVLVGGSVSSQHVKGEAADIFVPGVDNREVAEWISANTDFDQLILEFFVVEQGINSGWIHVSHSRHRNRGEKLAAVKENGGVRYVKTENYWDFE